MNRFLDGVFRVLQGTIVSQLIGFVALLVLARLFEPDAFGHFQLFTTCLTLALGVANLRYEIAVLQCRDDEVDAVLRLSLLVNVAVAVFAALACGAIFLGLGTRSAHVDIILLLLPFGLLAGGAIQLLGYLPLRYQEFALSARTKILQAAGFALAAIALGLAGGLPSSGLIVADVAGRAAAALFLVAWAARRGIRLLRPVPRAELAATARRHRELPLIGMPGGLVNSAGGLLTSILMYAVFDASTSGQYGLMERSFIAPMGMIAIAVAQVFTSEFARELREGAAGVVHSYRRVIRLMFLTGCGPALVVAAAGPWLYSFVFGDEWRQAGEFAQLSAPLVLAYFVTGPVNMTIMIAGRQRLQFAWEISRLALMGAAWLVIANSGASPRLAVITNVTIAVVMSLVFLWLADRVVQRIPDTRRPA